MHNIISFTGACIA